MKAFLALAALTLTMPVYAQDMPVEDEIVVTAKVNSVRMVLGHDPRGRVFCNLSKSSGDARIDKAVCLEAAKCVKRKPLAPPAMDACLAKRRSAIVKRWIRGQRA